MSIVLDAGGVSALAKDRGRSIKVRAYTDEPPCVPTVVLAECLTGDHDRDVPSNRLLKGCRLIGADEFIAREAARLRTSTGRADTISAVDAIVVATAATLPCPVVITSDPRDIGALAEHAARPITIVRS